MSYQARIVETDTGREVYTAQSPRLGDLLTGLGAHWNTLDREAEHAIEIDAGSGWARVVG